MILTLEKARLLKDGMLDPTLPRVGLTAPEMMDLLTLAVVGLEAMHATAGSGKCPACEIDGEPCPECYRAAWSKRHPTSGGSPMPRVVDIPNVD